MLHFMNCVAEAVMAKGIRGLAEWVPGGPYLYDVAGDAMKRLKDRRKRDEVINDLRRMAEATFADAKETAERVAREVASAAPLEDRLTLELYLSQMPGAIRKTLRRADDPSGKTVPPAFALDSPDDLLKMLPPQMPRFRPGDPLPNRPGWTLMEPLGAGGFGEVWKAEHDFIPDGQAVKFCTDPTAKDRLLTHEGKLIARVMKECRGPGVVRLLDADLSGSSPWLAYEYAGDGDLASLILAWQQLPVADRVARARDALQSLAATAGRFHALLVPIVHRDLKPANILVADGELKITDFGIGGIAAQKALASSRDGSTAYTRALSMLSGAYTPIYASPQQQRGEQPDPRDDVHALGVIAYQMLTGKLDAAPGPKFDKHLRTAGVPESLIDLIGDCVDPEAVHRPANGAEITKRLRATPKAAPPPTPQPAPQPPTPKQPAAPDPKRLAEAEADYQRGAAFHFGRGVVQDYAKAREWYEKAAAQGLAISQYGLGVLHDNGLGVVQDYATARVWYEKAAAQGDANAQCGLGYLYRNGQGVVQDYAKAREWYEKAAAQGFANAQCNLGILYHNGQGVVQDYAKAREWYEKAAAQGYANAQHNLALLHEHGQGVPKSVAKALEWYRKAAAQGYEDAKKAVARLEKKG